MGPSLLARAGLAAVSLYAWLACALLSVLCTALGAATWIIVRPFDPCVRAVHVFACIWGRLCIALNPFWSVRIVGRERFPRGEALVVCANHQSFVDIVAVACLFRQFKFVSKASVFRVPIVGWFCRLAGYVPVERGDRASVQVMLERCRTWLRRGMPIVVFPEGTRSPDGSVLPFKGGAFRLARECGARVLPVAVDGTRDALPKGSILFGARTRIVVSVLDPVSLADFPEEPEERALADHVRARIAGELARLRAPSAASGTEEG